MDIIKYSEHYLAKLNSAKGWVVGVGKTRMEAIDDCLSRACLVEKMHCPMCENGSLRYRLHCSTHIYVCNVCPFVGLEFMGRQNTIDLMNNLCPEYIISPFSDGDIQGGLTIKA